MGGTREGVKRWAISGREEERRRMWEAPESGIWGEERATSNVDGVGGGSCRGIASASLGLPPSEGSWGCPASSPMGIIGALGGPGASSRHKPGREGLMSVVVSGSVPVLPSVPPDPHRCSHPEGCVAGPVGDFLCLLLPLTIALVLALPLTGRAGGQRGGGEEGGEEGDVPLTLRTLEPWGEGCRGGGFDGAGVRRAATRGASLSSAPSSASSPALSPSTKALKAPPTIWGIGGGATGDHRGKEESLCKGDSTGRGEVRGREWESRELGKGGGRGRGVEKLGKEESRERDPSEWWSQRVGMWWLIIWEGGEDAEVRGGRIDWGEGGLASEGADKQEGKNEEEGEVPSARVPHWRGGAAEGGT